jgi:hypothetical protein
VSLRVAAKGLTVVGIKYELKRIVAPLESGAAVKWIAGLTRPHDQQFKPVARGPRYYGSEQLRSHASISLLRDYKGIG